MDRRPTESTAAGYPVAVSATPRTPAAGPGRAWLPAILLALAVGGFIGLCSATVARHMIWPWGSDSAYFLQRAWEATQGPVQPRTLLMLEQGHGAWGGRHHSPIISLYAPFVALWPRYETLLLVQSALLGLGVLPLFVLCWRATEDRITALLLLLAAVSVPGFIAIGVGDFRLVTTALALVPAVVLAAVFGPWPAMVAASVIACAAREEVAPLLLVALPWLVWERSRRRDESLWVAARTLGLGVALPALAWQIGTSWRLAMFLPGATTGFGSVELTTLPGTFLSVLVQDLRGALTPSPPLIVRIVQVLGLTAPLLLLRPLAALPLVLFWFGAGINQGVVNATQIHYYAPVVALFMALTPLALGRPDASARRTHLVRGLCVLLVALHVVVPFFDTPVSVADAWDRRNEEPPEERQLAALIGPTEPVIASGWLLPLLAPRRHMYCSQELSVDSQYDVLPSLTAALFILPLEDEAHVVIDSGFEEVGRTRNAVLYRRPGTIAR